VVLRERAQGRRIEGADPFRKLVMDRPLNTAQDQAATPQPSVMSVAVGILVSCCLSALLLSSLI
jgi:hypothetical protein